MEICFYEHECQLGDYVFADGSFSNRDNKTKTAVGTCVFIDNDNPSRRLCVALRDLGSYPWGLYSTNFPNIELKDTQGYSVYDVPPLTNKGSSGISGNITDANFRDESSNGDGQGFKILDRNTAAGEIGWIQSDVNFGSFHEGDILPWGLINTLKIINHRNIILQDSNVNLPLPQKQGSISEYNNLIQLMSDIVAQNGNNANYQQYYYPPASLCHHYEPSVKEGETLADNFKAGNWFLPSAGELARIYWYHSKGYVLGTDDAIFARALVDGNCVQFSDMGYWASTEYSSTSAWGISFNTGDLDKFRGTKNGPCQIRPMVAF